MVDGAIIDAADGQGLTALHVALLAGNDDARMALLNSGASLEAEAFGRTLLHRAAIGGDADVVQLLLDAGASPSPRAPDGGTALAAAAAEGHLDVCALLLHAGAEIDAANADGHTPLHAASSAAPPPPSASCSTLAPTRPRARRGSGSPLQLAAIGGHADAVRALLAAPGAAAAVDAHGFSALRWAAVHGQPTWRRCCSECPTAADEAARGDATDGLSLLALSAAAGHADVVDALLAVSPADALPLAHDAARSRGHARVAEAIAAVAEAAVQRVRRPRRRRAGGRRCSTRRTTRCSSSSTPPTSSATRRSPAASSAATARRRGRPWCGSSRGRGPTSWAARASTRCAPRGATAP